MHGVVYILTHVMEGLKSLTCVQHSQDEPQKRLRQLTGGKRTLKNMKEKTFVKVLVVYCI